jgi:hypothetical protein
MDVRQIVLDESGGKKRIGAHRLPNQAIRANPGHGYYFIRRLLFPS